MKCDPQRPDMWRKSSRSQNGSANCVEVAHVVGAVAVRDSKHPDGAVLIISPDPFTVFLSNARNNRPEK